MKKIKLLSVSKPQTANRVFIGLVCVLLGFGGGIIGAKFQDKVSEQNSHQEVLVSEGEVIKTIAQKVGPSVVSINVISQGSQLNIFGVQQPYEQTSAGTGVIISESGYILTNRHVIGQGKPKIRVTLSDGTELDNVEIIGRTSNNDSLDIAFLKIKDTKGKKLSAAKLGNSGEVEVGQKVVAIGNALGQFQNTVTSGIISGYGRNLIAGDSTSEENLQNLFQTDAAINQGNSGGPLVNANSEVIGINTAVAGDGAENIGFAIPIDDIKGIISTLLDQGKFQRPYLGVRYIDITEDFAKTNKLSVTHGAYLMPSNSEDTILPNSPATKAGLKEKDIIIKVNDTEVNEGNGLATLIGRQKVGDKVTLTIIRDGQEQKVELTVEAAPLD